MAHGRDEPTAEGAKRLEFDRQCASVAPTRYSALSGGSALISSSERFRRRASHVRPYQAASRHHYGATGRLWPEADIWIQGARAKQYVE